MLFNFMLYLNQQIYNKVSYINLFLSNLLKSKNLACSFLPGTKASLLAKFSSLSLAFYQSEFCQSSQYIQQTNSYIVFAFILATHLLFMRKSKCIPITRYRFTRLNKLHNHKHCIHIFIFLHLYHLQPLSFLNILTALMTSYVFLEH